VADNWRLIDTGLRSAAQNIALSRALLEAVQAYPGGLLRATVMLEATTQTLRQVWFHGDCAAKPGHAISALEAALRDVPMSRLARKVEWFFRSRPVEMIGLGPEDFVAVVRRAVGRPLLVRNM